VHALEANAIEAEHSGVGPGHQDRTDPESLHPPEIAGVPCVELFPPPAVEVQNERAPALVGSYRVDIGGRPATHRHQRRRKLAREKLPLARARSRRRLLVATEQHAYEQRKNPAHRSHAKAHRTSVIMD
jgi:hypothetical protein